MITDHKGNISSMRVGFITCLVIGAISTLSGVFAMFYGVPDASVAITAGSALMGGSGFSKAVQTRYERDYDNK